MRLPRIPFFTRSTAPPPLPDPAALLAEVREANARREAEDLRQGILWCADGLRAGGVGYTFIPAVAAWYRDRGFTVHDRPDSTYPYTITAPPSGGA